MDSDSEEGSVFVNSNIIEEMFEVLIESWLETKGEDTFAKIILDKRVRQLSKSNGAKKRKI